MLDILGQSAQNMLELSEYELLKQSKHTELVMKCTWKLIKAIPQMLQESSLDIASLLHNIHDFLLATPPLEWKRRSSISIPQADMPLRTVKTILSMIISNIGERYVDYIFLIQDPISSHAVQYLKQISNSTRKDNGLSSEEIKSRLEVIFEKISNKEETKLGIQELYEFQKNHSYASELVEDRLSQTGAYFQGYIRRGLNALRESEASESEFAKSSQDNVTKTDTNMNYSKSKPKADECMQSNEKDATSSQEACLPAMDRSLAVAELKERLAKMKLNMQKK